MAGKGALARSLGLVLLQNEGLKKPMVSRFVRFARPLKSGEQKVCVYRRPRTEGSFFSPSMCEVLLGRGTLAPVRANVSNERRNEGREESGGQEKKKERGEYNMLHNNLMKKGTC